MNFKDYNMKKNQNEFQEGNPIKNSLNTRNLSGFFYFLIGFIMLLIQLIINFYSIPYSLDPRVPYFPLLNSTHLFIQVILYFFPFLLMDLGVFQFSKRLFSLVPYFAAILAFIGLWIAIYYSFIHNIPITLPNNDILYVHPYSSQSKLPLIWSLAAFVWWWNIQNLENRKNKNN